MTFEVQKKGIMSSIMVMLVIVALCFNIKQEIVFQWLISLVKPSMIYVVKVEKVIFGMCIRWAYIGIP